MSGSFADSNILLYLPDEDRTKAEVAERVLERGLTISVQVLNEIAVVMLRKWGRSWAEIEAFLADVRAAVVVRAVDEDTHDLGLAIAREHRFHIYDSMIVAAALLADCDTLYSEDLHPGLIVRKKLTIVNPFA